jgi:hypothetical protein
MKEWLYQQKQLGFLSLYFSHWRSIRKKHNPELKKCNSPFRDERKSRYVLRYPCPEAGRRIHLSESWLGEWRRMYIFCTVHIWLKQNKYCIFYSGMKKLFCEKEKSTGRYYLLLIQYTVWCFGERRTSTGRNMLGRTRLVYRPFNEDQQEWSSAGTRMAHSMATSLFLFGLEISLYGLNLIMFYFSVSASSLLPLLFFISWKSTI